MALRSPTFLEFTRREWTVEDINAPPENGIRYEVIESEPFLTPGPSELHQDAVGELFACLRKLCPSSRDPSVTSR
jgi:hypothetical protein